MKKLAALFALIAIICITCACSSKSNQYHASAIELKSNEYTLQEDLDTRIDIPFRQVVFYWDYSPGELGMATYSEAVIHKDYVGALIDSVAAIHLNPRANPYTGELERRLIGVNIKEPILETVLPEYGVPELAWVSVADWHIN